MTTTAARRIEAAKNTALRATLEAWGSKSRRMGCVSATRFLTSRVPGFYSTRKTYYTADGDLYQHVVATDGLIEIDLAPYACKPSDS